MYQTYWNNLVDSLWAPESWIKVVFLLVTSPIWVPVLRSMAREVQEVLAPEGGLYANKTPRAVQRRAPGEDPFLSIPYAAQRRARRAAREEALGTRTVRPATPNRAPRGGAVRTPRSRARRPSGRL
ncbi:MAG TPA: hypothetical protein ENJ09_12130 [Planctomycetes bacterium]|nr:hypothetical protein [Planctomycetota bacterium]